MVVEGVAPATGVEHFRRVVRGPAFAVGLPTMPMVMLWPCEQAHRSLLGSVAACLWTLSSITLVPITIAGPDEEPEEEIAQ